MKFVYSAFILCCILSSTTILAQSDTSGVITYLEKIEFQIDLPQDSTQPPMPFAFPKEITNYFDLKFFGSKTLYSANDSLNNLAERKRHQKREEGGGFMIKMDSGEDEHITYTDYAANEVIDQVNFMTRLFLVQSTPTSPKWKITGQQKKIKEYLVLEATSVIDSAVVRAWFCPTIPAKIGPRSLTGLPGAILEVYFEGDKVTYTAEEITLKPIQPSEIIKPKKGKKVTQKEFNEIVEEKTKEMEAQFGGGPGGGKPVMITIRH
jgi:GLPGLI family protein